MKHHTRYSPAKTSGFTLIELLVVVVIISISIGYVVVNIVSDDENAIAKEEITRLQQLLRFAHEQSVVRAVEYGVRFYETGYRFLIYDEENNVWRPLNKDRFLRSRSLPEDLELNLYIEQTPVEILNSPSDDPVIKEEKSSELETAASKITTQSQFDSSNQQDKKILPQIFLLSSSELVPPFEVRMRIPGTEIEAHLEGLAQSEFNQVNPNE